MNAPPEAAMPAGVPGVTLALELFAETTPPIVTETVPVTAAGDTPAARPSISGLIHGPEPVLTQTTRFDDGQTASKLLPVEPSVAMLVCARTIRAGNARKSSTVISRLVAFTIG